MSRDLIRRLKSLELALPAARDPAALTDDHRAAFVALDALVVAVLLGEFQDGDDPMDALCRGIEKAYASSDRVSPIRAGFAQRLKGAACIALNGTESVAVPQDWFERSRSLLDRPCAGNLMEAFSSLYIDHPGFADPAKDRAMLTRIERDGTERFCWPEKAGADAPPAGSRGQGLKAAARYWA